MARVPAHRALDPRSVRSWLTPGRVLAWGTVTVLLAWLLVGSPLSPVSETRASALLAGGRAVEAGELYERIALYHPLPEVRWRSWMNASMVWMVDAKDPNRARSCLMYLIESDAPADVRAAAWDRLAWLLAGPLNQASEASNAWKMAYEADEDAERAGFRLASSARAMTEAGHADEAYAIWDKVARRFDDRRAESRLAQAHILLGKGRLGLAQTHFKQVKESEPDAVTEAIAQEGLVAVEERMERLKSTLNQLESRDIPLELRRRIEKAEQNPAAHEIEAAPDEKAGAEEKVGAASDEKAEAQKP